MIDLNFGEHGGGPKTFPTLESLFAFAKERVDEWSNDKPFQKAAGQNAELRRVWNNWSDIQRKFQNHRVQIGDDIRALNLLLADFNKLTYIARKSRAGIIIRDLTVSDVNLGVGAASYFMGDSNVPLLFGQSRKIHEGVLAAWARDYGLDSRSAVHSREIQRRTASEMEAREGEHHRQLTLIEQKLAQEIEIARSAHEERKREFTLWKNSISVNFDEVMAKFQDDIADDRARWDEEWQEKRDLYVEQLRIRAAVEQWKGRAAEHEQSFKNLRRWTIGTGIVGLIIAVIWAAASLHLAEWLFSDALVSGQAKLMPGTLRPTWLHELIFAASASVLFLTLYLWLMRILVRTLMSEQHLCLDAKSRSSMAHTYLALAEEHAMDEKDRAIILASLFRPVTDGLVTDDALPIFSPASFFSGTLAGK